jgi:dCMP deaminase
MLTNAQIDRYVSFGKYNDDAFVDLFGQSGIKFDIRERPSSCISYLD